MLYLILSVVFSVLLLVNFRTHARFQVDTRIAILLNYPVCFLTAYFHQPSAIPFHWPSTWDSFLLMFMGVGFVITFLLSGFSTQKNGMAPTSLANNISLVIPVLINLFILFTLAINKISFSCFAINSSFAYSGNKPYQLFIAKKFEDIDGLEWLSLPPMLAGTIDAEMDMRFEEEETKT
jgi:hypothetical protein